MANDELTEIHCTSCDMRFLVVEGTKHMVNYCAKCGEDPFEPQTGPP